MYIDNKHNIGEIVYLLTDYDGTRRVVTSITIRSGGYLEYGLSCGEKISYHVETEISKQKVLY